MGILNLKNITWNLIQLTPNNLMEIVQIGGAGGSSGGQGDKGTKQKAHAWKVSHPMTWNC